VDELYTRRIMTALRQIKALPGSEHSEIIGLGLPLHESLVVAHLRVAGHLLANDTSLDVLRRNETWTHWLEDITYALEHALRYRENDPLVVTLGVVRFLYLHIYPHASLRGFKALDDAISAATRELTAVKRERSRQRLDLRDVVQRAAVWVGPAGGPGGLVYRDDALNGEECSMLHERGYRQVWGVEVQYSHTDRVIFLVRGVLPVACQPSGSGALIAALEQPVG
jgi:hypothetical protein